MFTAISNPLFSAKNTLYGAVFTGVACYLVIRLNFSWLKSFDALKGYGLTQFAKTADTAVLISLVLLIFLISSRYLFSLLVSIAVYTAFIVASAMKASVFEAPLYPKDVYLLSDLVLAKGSFYHVLPYALSVLTAFIVLLVVSWKFSTVAKSSFRPGICALSFVVLCWCSLFFVASLDNPVMRKFKYDYVSVQNWLPLYSAASSGFLFEYCMELASPNQQPVPKGYSRQRVEEILSRYSSFSSHPAVQDSDDQGEPINLIIYLVEAFVDPARMGVRTTEDPMPNFKGIMQSHSSGTVLSPVIGGGSANAEFEILTGMSMRLLSRGTTPYKHSIKQPIQSLASELKVVGYQSTAMHVASLGFYNYREAYKNLGFDMSTSLWGKPDIEKSISERMPSDSALVDSIIERGQQSSPYLIFAFPNSTHHAWDYSGYEGSSLKVLGSYPAKQKDALTIYINALKTADEAIAKLVSHYEDVPEKTAILILGDHFPTIHRLASDEGVFPPSGLSKEDEFKLLHQLDAVIWTNYGAPKNDFDLSFNLLTSRLLEQLNIRPSNFLAVSDRLRNELGVFSHLVRNEYGELEFDVPESARDLIEDYQMLQYDWLHGEQYQRSYQNSYQR